MTYTKNMVVTRIKGNHWHQRPGRLGNSINNMVSTPTSAIQYFVTVIFSFIKQMSIGVGNRRAIDVAEPKIVPTNLGLREVANSPLTSPKFIKTHRAVGSINILSIYRLDIVNLIFMNGQALLG